MHILNSAEGDGLFVAAAGLNMPSVSHMPLTSAPLWVTAGIPIGICLNMIG